MSLVSKLLLESQYFVIITGGGIKQAARASVHYIRVNYHVDNLIC